MVPFSIYVNEIHAVKPEPPQDQFCVRNREVLG